MVLINISSRDFLHLGLDAAGFNARRQQRCSDETNIENFRANFGVGPKTCRAVFKDFQRTDIEDAHIDNPSSFYFLVALYWMKAYPREKQMAGHFDRDEKTLRIQIRKYVGAIAALKGLKIAWIDVGDDGEVFILTVDGVHFRINEPRQFPTARWYSHKSNSSGLVYEIAISIFTGKVVWINGPFMASTSDTNIFLGHERAKTKAKLIGADGKESEEPYECLYDKIPAGKKGIADNLYDGDCLDKLATSNDFDAKDVRRFKRRARARHENFNDRLKSFAILDERFRHGVPKHKTVFEAACVLCQYEIDIDHPLMDM